MKKVTAKFICQSVTDYGDIKTIKLTAVTDTNPVNSEFFKYTPSGSIEINCVNNSTADAFIPMKEYYIDFTIAE